MKPGWIWGRSLNLSKAKGIVLPLLKEVRRYADIQTAPGGRDDCEDGEILG